MSRFRDEVEIVPRPAFAIAVCVWLAFFLLMMLLPFRMDPEGRNWPLAGKLALSVLPGLPSVRDGLAGGLCLQRRQAARHAVCAVDLAGGPDPQRHRDHPVLRFARTAAGELHAVAARRCGRGLRFVRSAADRWRMRARSAGAPSSRAGPTARTAARRLPRYDRVGRGGAMRRQARGQSPARKASVARPRQAKACPTKSGPARPAQASSLPHLRRTKCRSSRGELRWPKSGFWRTRAGLEACPTKRPISINGANQHAARTLESEGRISEPRSRDRHLAGSVHRRAAGTGFP
jgi:hypothetical protein